jgi:uncharacterized membrane protein YjjP (DUF1212 family)
MAAAPRTSKKPAWLPFLRLVDAGIGVYVAAAGVDMCRVPGFDTVIVGAVTLLVGALIVIESLMRLPVGAYFLFLERFWGRGLLFML